jgi:hypothetical protein
MADAEDLKSSGPKGRAGSSPALGIKKNKGVWERVDLPIASPSNRLDAIILHFTTTVGGLEDKAMFYRVRLFCTCIQR